MWTRRELKTNAKAILKRNYWMAVVVSLIMTAAAGIVGTIAGMFSSVFSSVGISFTTLIENTEDPYAYSEPDLGGVLLSLIVVIIIIAAISFLVSLFILNPLQVGVNYWFLKNRTENPDIEEIGKGFKDNYFQTVLTLFMRSLFIALWSLLLIVPGIVKSYEYRMVPFIVAENPDLTWREALARSKEMMYGQKWKTFVLDLTLIGWALLGAYCCCGLVMVLFVGPYFALIEAELYAALCGYGEPVIDKNINNADSGVVDVNYEDVNDPAPYTQSQEKEESEQNEVGTDNSDSAADADGSADESNGDDAE